MISMNMRYFIYFITVAGFCGAARADGGPDAATDDTAIAQIETGDIDAAAREVGRANLAASGSLAWYQQSALALLGRAEQLKASGDYDGSHRAADAAIRMMAQGLRKGGADARPADRAQMYVQLADTCDRLLGDRASARQYYRRALQDMPDLDDAKRALSSFDSLDARLLQFQQQSGN